MDSTDRHNIAELELMTAIAAGEQSAFERLYSLYEKRVFQYVSGLVFDATLAEEIVADTMLAVWRGASTFNQTSRVSTWIFGIARHKALDAIRRSGRQKREVNLDDALDVPTVQESPIDGLQRQEVASMIQRALTTLSPEHREILRLVFYEELPYEEISKLLSIPINTVKTRVYYAKQNLKQQLERVGRKEPIR